MRLIDADKVKQYALTEGFYCDTDADKEATAEEIDQLFPTVEAIPVEWIKQLLDDAELAGQPYTVNILKRILNRWEKENGTDRQR